MRALKYFVWLVSLSLLVCAQTAPPKYIGAGGCASSNCHGGTTPAPENVSRILTTEYAIWASQDKHSNAEKVLENERSKRMAELLNIPNASLNARCTVCHVVGSPEKTRSDGVACEGCHGPAERWLGTHTQANSHAASLSLGMIDTKNLVTRSKTCLQCHLGAEDRQVDHELIAAGHPDLQFELDTFTWAQPSHHRDPKSAPGNTLPRVRAWAVGQSTRLADGMRQLARRAESRWPEFAGLECSECHHDLRSDSWRIQRGYAGRRPGALQMDPSLTEVARILAAQTPPGTLDASLDKLLDKLASLLAEHFSDGPAIAQAARAVAQEADALTRCMEQRDFTVASARAMVRALAVDAPRIGGQGVYAAEQASMSLDSLMAAVSHNDPKLQKAMGEIYDYLERPAAYNGREFAILFRKVANQLE